MMRYSKLALIVFLLLGLNTCKNKDLTLIPKDTQETTYEQYGTPLIDLPENQDIIMYEVNVRAFSSGGDIQGVISKLDHIESLGVNVIWLMPIHPIGAVNSVNSPYSVADYKAVGAEFGTLNDLRTLTDQAHSRGIAVIMDWVANHTAWDNPWIINKDWYTQDQNGNIIHPAGTNWQDVADLNYNNTDMRAAMIDAMQYWLYEANIDGFRCDHADGVPFDFWQQAWLTMDTIPNREFILFAEGSRNDHFAAGFDLNFSWSSYGALRDVFNGQAATKIFTAHSNEYANIPDGKHWIRYTTNHDESAWNATPISLFDGIDGALAASAVTIFTGGVPLIYGSQEVGVANTVPFFYTSTINWNSNPEMLASYQKMLQFYAASHVAKTGFNTYYNDNDIVCLKKSLNNEELLIIANLRNTTIDFSIPADVTNSAWTDVMTQNAMNLSDQISISPYQFYILKK